MRDERAKKISDIEQPAARAEALLSGSRRTMSGAAGSISCGEGARA